MSSKVHRRKTTTSRIRHPVADRKTITIEVSERTAEALEYIASSAGVDPAKVASSMVEYCCANSFQQAPSLIFDFAIDALKWKPDDMWHRYSTCWHRHANQPSHDSGLDKLTVATEQMRQKSFQVSGARADEKSTISLANVSV